MTLSFIARILHKTSQNDYLGATSKILNFLAKILKRIKNIMQQDLPIHRPKPIRSLIQCARIDQRRASIL